MLTWQRELACMWTAPRQVSAFISRLPVWQHGLQGCQLNSTQIQGWCSLADELHLSRTVL